MGFWRRVAHLGQVEGPSVDVDFELWLFHDRVFHVLLWL